MRRHPKSSKNMPDLLPVSTLSYNFASDYASQRMRSMRLLWRSALDAIYNYIIWPEYSDITQKPPSAMTAAHISADLELFQTVGETESTDTGQLEGVW